MNFLGGRARIIAVPFSIILNTKSCPNSAPTNGGYNLAKGKNNSKPGREEQRGKKKRKGKKRLGTRGERACERGVKSLIRNGKWWMPVKFQVTMKR